ncbi:hypothetical protein FBU59_001002 [Linderina macrospora]|uniref:Uncharacterized protein n=1 Tax=Linderina macrospora TaxID=4868 RepID=A0ACC1JF27_9FUNG|nr:hypothetical protein FBU59_001002 [Linderina macrospora]
MNRVALARRVIATPARSYASKAGYEESAKQQWRNYSNWRKHFTWKRSTIREFFRDYTLWSALGLVAYIKLTQRQEFDAYTADAYVKIDDLQDKINQLKPSPPAEQPTSTPEPKNPDTTSRQGPSSNMFF